MTTTNENLGPAERIIQSVISYTDHLYHGRPGIVTPAANNIGVQWTFCTHRVQEVDGRQEKVVFKKEKVGRKTVETRMGVMRDLGTRVAVIDNGREIGEYREPGLYPEVAAWMYRQVADVWKLDNEFAARWASYAFTQDNRDLKVVLASFMCVQSRKGDPVRDDGKVAFYDEDYRDVGEAMMLIRRKDDKDLDPKQLLRMYDFLTLPAIVQLNRDLGFANSARKPALGRWPTVVTKWLRHREENPKILDGLVRGAFKSTVQRLVRLVHYKPESPKFFETLGWKQHQADDGRRTLAIGTAITTAHSLDGKTEAEICEYVVKERPAWKRFVAMVPKNVGITRAIVAAAIEAKTLSDADLIIATPTLEDLGLLTEVPAIRARWEKAVKDAENMRANNIAKRVKSKDLQEKLGEAADNAVKKAVEEVVRGLRIYLIVDISSSMDTSIEQAKAHLAKIVQAFPLDKTHVSVFNTVGRVVEIKHASAAGVENAFRGIAASGGTAYGEGVRALVTKFKPDADEDALFLFVGDEECTSSGTQFAAQIRAFGVVPVAFGLLKISGHGRTVRDAAAALGIPCFMIDPKIFDDVYAIPRTLRNLIAATPVGVSTARVVAPRVTLIDQILKTDLLTKPVWA